MSKNFFFLLLIPIFWAGTKPKYPKNLDFVILSASKQVINGGVYGSPKVSNYTLKIKAIRSFTFTADTAYAEGRKNKITILNDSNQIVKKCKVIKNKTYTVFFSIATPTQTDSNFPENNFLGSPEGKCKIKSPTKTVVLYKGGKSKYLLPAKISALEEVHAP